MNQTIRSHNATDVPGRCTEQLVWGSGTPMPDVEAGLPRHGPQDHTHASWGSAGPTVPRRVDDNLTCEDASPAVACSSVDTDDPWGDDRVGAIRDNPPDEVAAEREPANTTTPNR